MRIEIVGKPYKLFDDKITVISSEVYDSYATYALMTSGKECVQCFDELEKGKHDVK